MGKKGTIGPDGKISRPLAPLEQLKRKKKKKKKKRKRKERLNDNMGKKGTIGPDGKISRPLAPLEQLKRQQKKKDQQKKDKERRDKKFKQQIEDDPEVLKRKVGALEKQDKMGLLTQRQRQEKWEMKQLLNEYAPMIKQKEAAAAAAAARAAKAKATAGPSDGVTVSGLYVGGTPAVPPPEPVSETAPPAETAEPVEPAPKLVQNPALMMSMVPRSVTKKRAVTSKVKAVIPGELDISREELVTSIAPSVPVVETPHPTVPVTSTFTASKTSVDLVPDFGYGSDDSSGDSIPEYTPSGAASSSAFFNTSMTMNAQKRTSTQLDDEYDKFMNEVGK
eukprot:TRINITY_DN36890_c0_g1_i1.p1 TRINITY_DN36890_c0_g1~~TRINITY_DN36890_c0_g1_i1.p1  ORF type:complete len:352 (+),score=64.92 TRINITY_DN36890_c0_g1_i1:53-1057(+)